VRRGSRSEAIDPVNQSQRRTPRVLRGAGWSILDLAYGARFCGRFGLNAGVIITVGIFVGMPQAAGTFHQNRWTTLPIEYGDNGRPIVAQSANNAARLDAWVEEVWWRERMGHRDRYALGLSCFVNNELEGKRDAEYRLRIIAEGGSNHLRGSPLITVETNNCPTKALGEFTFSIGAWSAPVTYDVIECIAKDSEIVLTSPELRWTYTYTLDGSARAVNAMKCEVRR